MEPQVQEKPISELCRIVTALCRCVKHFSAFFSRGIHIPSVSQPKGAPGLRNHPTEEKTMRTLFYAAIVAAAATGISPAIAGDGEGTIANTEFTQLPGVIAQSPVPSVSAVARVRDSQRAATFVTQTSPDVWLIPPYDGGGDNR